jgi:hypothetical protein
MGEIESCIHAGELKYLEVQLVSAGGEKREAEGVVVTVKTSKQFGNLMGVLSLPKVGPVVA